MNGIPEVNEASDLRIKLLRFNANPYLHQPTMMKYIDSPVVTIEIYDALTNKLHIDISNKIDLTDLIEIKIPYSSIKGFDR